MTGDVRPGSGQMFDAIAARYDLLNRVLSMGIDRGWRRKMVASLELAPGARVLDVATGTADVALELARAGAEVVGLDPSLRMLDVATRKVAEARLANQIQLVEGDALALPHGDASFDAVTIAFGIRNVPDRPAGLAEMRRVLRPGGRLAVLELAEPRGGVLGPLARFHIRTVVPRIGAWLSGAPAYRYLQQSIAAFPPAEEFAAMMRAAGLAVREVRPLTFGVCTLFVGEVAR